MTEDQEIARGEEAERLLSHPLFKECMQRMKDEIIAQWSAAPARDTDGREWLWQFHQVAHKFENTLRNLMETGKMASIKKRETLKERAAKIWGVR